MLKEKGNVIRIPTPPSDAFDQNRVLSSQLKIQIEQITRALKKQVLDLDDEVMSLKTEGDAAAYIKKITRVLRALSSKG